MESHIEKAYYLTFGKIKIDVSNVQYLRQVKVANIWNERINNEKETAESLNDMSHELGIYLIKQSMKTLTFRMMVPKAIISYIKRLFITKKTIEHLNKSQYEAFQGWLYFVLTGQKKKTLEIKTTILDQAAATFLEMESKYGLSLEECLELLQISLQDQVHRSAKSILSRRA